MPDQSPSPDNPRLLAQLTANPLRVGLGCLRAVAELARARLVLARLTPASISACNRHSASVGRSPQDARPADEQLVSGVAQILPRIAPWMPWRSDCLVQALAAQNWLARQHIASQIVIGADTSGKDGFEAHAWLHYGKHVVTGGAILRYTVLLNADGAEN